MDKSLPPLVTLHGCGVFRADRWIARRISFSIRPGEIVTLIGPNGSGKSTTARMALGLIKPDEGSVARRAGLRIGYVPQKLAVDWTLPLTVRRFMGLTEAIAPKAVSAALERTGVAHLENADMQTLSGGETQRVMLARAMARAPDLLVLDEPVQGVDFNGEIALYDLVRAHRDETGCGVLLISHDLHVVMAATDQVICLNGHVCCQGTPKTVAASAAYRELFGARAASSIAIYEHHHDHTHLPDGRVAHADGSVTDNCHPEDGHHGHHHDHEAMDHDPADHDHAGHDDADHDHAGHGHAPHRAEKIKAATVAQGRTSGDA
jgi:zinc transport system ATP-binding protein